MPSLPILLGLQAASGAVDEGKRTAGKVLNQAINISVGDINPKQIIKYCVYIAIFIIICLLIIQFIRVFVVAGEQVSCGLSHMTGGGEVCSPTDVNSIITGRYWMWEAEWVSLCILYIDFGIITGLLLYTYAMWLFNKLLRIDLEIKKIENWIFGMELEGEAERQIENRL